jgi:hypothetical protein
MNGEIRALPRAIDREEAKRDNPHLIQMRIGRAEKFAGNFRGGVGTDRLREMQALGERHRLGNAVNGGAGGEDEALDSSKPRRFQQMQRAADVRVVIKLRLLDRGSHPCARRQMRHGVEFFPVKKQVHRAAVAQVDPMNRGIPRHRFDIGALDLRVVKVIEIVEDRDFVSRAEQLFHQVRADKARSARD